MAGSGFHRIVETLEWRRGHFRLVEEHGLTRLRPVGQTEAYTLRFPPGPMSNGHPAYVWFANAWERGENELLSKVDQFGTLLRLDQRWCDEKGAAASLLLVLLLAHALQNRSSATLREAIAIVRSDLSGSTSRRQLEEHLSPTRLPWDEEESQKLLNMDAERGRRRWQDTANLLSIALGHYELSPMVRVPDEGEPVVSSLLCDQDLYGIVRLAVWSNLASGARVRRCANLGCERNRMFVSFLANRQYCSVQCQRAAGQRRHRERKAEEAAAKKRKASRATANKRKT